MYAHTACRAAEHLGTLLNVRGVWVLNSLSQGPGGPDSTVQGLLLLLHGRLGVRLGVGRLDVLPVIAERDLPEDDFEQPEDFLAI